MVEKMAADYARIFQSANPDREINPICMNIEDMLARLDEFETQLANVKAETNDIMDNHISSIIGYSDNFQTLRERIDNLEQFVEVVNSNVSEVEKSLDIAEEELNVTDYSFKGLLLKPLLAKAKSSGGSDGSDLVRTNLKDGEFQQVAIFQTNEYFGGSKLDSTEEAQENDIVA